MGSTPPRAVAVPDSAQRAVRVCLDVNIFVADFLSGRHGNPAGASSKIVDLFRSGTSRLDPLRLLPSWRMPKTLEIVLERLGETPDFRCTPGSAAADQDASCEHQSPAEHDLGGGG